MDEIESKVALLPDYPERCRVGRVHGTRELMVRPDHVVVYHEDAEAVTILRALHAAQMWP